MLEKTMDFNQIGGIEKELGVFMTPVDPDPDFVQSLGRRLRAPKSVSIEGELLSRPVALFVILFGLVAGIVSVFLLRRLR